MLLTLILCLAPRAEALHISIDAFIDGHYGDTLAGLFSACARYALGAMRRCRESGGPMPVAPLFRLRELHL